MILVKIGLCKFMWFGMYSFMLVLKIFCVKLIIFGILVVLLVNIMFLGNLNVLILFRIFFDFFKICFICVLIIFER